MVMVSNYNGDGIFLQPHCRKIQWGWYFVTMPMVKVVLLGTKHFQGRIQLEIRWGKIWRGKWRRGKVEGLTNGKKYGILNYKLKKG